MTYDLYHIDDCVRLPHAKQFAVLTRLRASIEKRNVGEERLSKFATYLKAHGKTLATLTFEEMIMLWGWATAFEEATEDLVSLYPEEEYASDEDQLFECMAPDMEDHSFIELENGKSRYRKYFLRGRVIDQDGVYTYPPVEGSDTSTLVLQISDEEWRRASQWIAATIFDLPGIEGLNEFDAEELGQRILREILRRFPQVATPVRCTNAVTPDTPFPHN